MPPNQTKGTGVEFFRAGSQTKIDSGTYSTVGGGLIATGKLQER